MNDQPRFQFGRAGLLLALAPVAVVAAMVLLRPG